MSSMQMVIGTAQSAVLTDLLHYSKVRVLHFDQGAERQSLRVPTTVPCLGAYFADSAVSMPRRPRKPSAFLAKKDANRRDAKMGSRCAPDPAAAAEWLEELKKYSDVALPNTALSESEVLIFFVAIIFGLFTCIMACDQVSNITSNTTGIDVMKGKDKEAVQRPWRESVQEVMGRGPSWRWLLPTPLRHTTL
ncbi:Hypothetical protein SCF082_LOCUS12264 [Durusdinium trenchii]|uniref:Uncharacterized protein n=1 Tax=Durusdinium trenchii TaxID=1381693 RepID=A0ABP0JIS2_9DINO